jgi:hypothetical protein
MNGGLLKSASQVALVAAASLLVGGVAMPSAKAADLGGDCCADLEERVAELEATTARKGNRRVSLTISGQVDKMVLWWDDGVKSGFYKGLDNGNASTRITFGGNARISPRLTAGYYIELEMDPQTDSVHQGNNDGFGGAGGPQQGFGIIGDGGMEVRLSNWYLDDKEVGRLTVGRILQGGPVGTIDLGGISVIASQSVRLLNGGFGLVPSGTFAPSTVTITAITDPVYGAGRAEGLRYDSPSLMGFLISGSWTENDNLAASLRYAGEFSGFRVAAGIGWLRNNDFVNTGTGAFPAAGGTPTPAYPTAEGDQHQWSASLAVLHVPSGLFLQGHYGTTIYNRNATGGSESQRPDAHQFLIQGGIAQNWTGLGNTALYAEWSRLTDFGAPFAAGAVPDSNIDVAGIGVVQNIDAAAMELYLGWRHFYNIDTTNVGVAGFREYRDFDAVAGGARIKY